MAGIHRDIMFHLDKEDKLICMQANQYMPFPSIACMKSIMDECKRYIRKHKTEDGVNKANQDWQDQEDLKEIRRARIEREDRGYVPKQKPADRPCLIYLIKDTLSGFHKVGKTKNIDSRFTQLKTANPCIELVCFYQGFHRDESEIHRLLEALDKRVGGEWFNMDKDDIEVFNQYFMDVTA